MSRLTKPRFLFAYLFVACFFVIANTSESRIRLGLPLVLLGALVRVWANGFVGHVKVNWTEQWRNDPKIGQLITGGPYAYMRHPLYLGSLLIGLGFCVMAAPVWFAVVGLGGLIAVYHGKIIEEETLLLHEWADEWQRYQQRVPRYLPTWRRYPHAQGQWSWQGIVASKELKTLAWVIVTVIALYFREELFQERESLFQKHQLMRMSLLCLLVVLVLADGLSELYKYRARQPATAAPPPGHTR